MALDGWTKVGDQVEATGKWTIYKLKRYPFPSVVADEEFEDAIKAAKVFDKKSEALRRGALWLVSPVGVVKRATFLR